MELALHEPCVVFALRREASAFLREFRPTERFAGAPCRARFCGPPWLSVLVLETGVGPAAMEKALEWLLAGPIFGNLPYRPRVVLSAGFSGALQPGYVVGDLVLATEVADGAGQVWPATWPGVLPAGDWRPPIRRGRLLCVPELVGNPARKRELGTAHAAVAVDMETAVVARLCRQHGVPFGCLRVVSDTVDTALAPELLRLLVGGRVSPLRLATTLVSAPRLLPELWRLNADTRKAADQLGKGLGELLTLTLDWMNDERS